jgi:hypothetical protein
MRTASTAYVTPAAPRRTGCRDRCPGTSGRETPGEFSSTGLAFTSRSTAVATNAIEAGNGRPELAEGTERDHRAVTLTVALGTNPPPMLRASPPPPARGRRSRAARAPSSLRRRARSAGLRSAGPTSRLRATERNSTTTGYPPGSAAAAREGAAAEYAVPSRQPLGTSRPIITSQTARRDARAALSRRSSRDPAFPRARSTPLATAAGKCTLSSAPRPAIGFVARRHELEVRAASGRSRRGEALDLPTSRPNKRMPQATPGLAFRARSAPRLECVSTGVELMFNRISHIGCASSMT